MVKLQIGENRVGITFESLAWFLAFTALGTVIGAVAYTWIQPYLPAALQPTPTTPTVPGLTGN
ncbi:MAG: hypothetical protein ACRD33_00120 [Candidatus Acidiferrales bacterium]